MKNRGLLLAVGLLFVPRPSWGDGFDADLFRPSSPSSGHLAIDRAEVLEDRHLSFGAGLVVARDLLVARDESGTELMDVVDSRFGFHLLADYGLLDRFQLGLRLPMVLHQEGDPQAVTPESSLSSASLGDVRLRGKARLYGGRTGGAELRLAAAAEATLPTGDEESFAGAGGAELEPSLLASAKSGRLSASLHLGYRLRERTELANLVVDDEVILRAGVAAAVLPERLWALAEAHAAVGVYGGSERERPAEVLFGGRYALGGGKVHVRAGVGFGLGEGYGAPALRGVASVAYLFDWSRTEPAPPVIAEVQDRDGDEIPDPADDCPDEAEDLDEFEDEDGCPDADNDGDGIADAEDECPVEPEDADGFEDEDGCPDTDNDEDGIEDAEDDCPDEAEDLDEFEDEDGCPDADNDGDGIADAEDECPVEPEDADGFEDEDGCPDADNDGDGIPDLADKCPDEAENFNGNEDDDGCPDEGKTLVRLTEEKLEIEEKIHFRTGKARILRRANKLLATVAKVLILHPEIKRVRIEGHTDSRGPADYNLELSHKRANAVHDHLVQKNGIDPARLEAAGFGEEKPIEDNATRAGRAANRRVEFTIVERE